MKNKKILAGIGVAAMVCLFIILVMYIAVMYF